jgi:type VI secretion system protein ImpG
VREDLVQYYERELSFLRRMGAEFGEKYPKIASRLLIEQDKCEDPHVERLLEGFAFLAARVHLKIDDEFPEITEALLNILYPHYLRPIPSMSVVQFHVDADQPKPETGLKIPRGSMLLSRPVDGLACRFRTAYDVTLWPLNVSEAQWRTPDRLNLPVRGAEAVGAIRLELACAGDVTFARVGLRGLRFYLTGEPDLVHTLHELLLNNCVQVIARDLDRPKLSPITLPAGVLRAAGFAEDESLLPYTRRSFAGYQLLQEYFCFPQKFLFVDFNGMEAICQAGFSGRAEIAFLISPFERSDRLQVLETGISARTFRLGCTPAVNLFPHTADPILLDYAHTEYRVVPDVTRQQGMEVFSIEEVVSAEPDSQEVVHFEPFYAHRHGAARRNPTAFWHAVRRPSSRDRDPGSEVYLTLVDLSGKAAHPNLESLTVRTLCSNRDLASRLPFGHPSGDFELQGAVPVKRTVALHKPTDTLRPPMARESLWRLISQLSLNYLSLVDDGVDALREILRLYDFTRSPYAAKQIDGLAALRSRPHFARVGTPEGVAFVRGTRVEIELDEEQFVGGGAFLFASLLESFLGLYVSLNSFSQLLVRTHQRKEVLKLWPPRSGRRILL